MSHINGEPEAVRQYRENLPDGELVHFPYHGLDRLGVPAYSAALWPEGGEPCNGFSYGTTEGEAAIGAFGEMMEETAAYRALRRMPRTRASYGDLVSQYGEGSVLDPVEACLEAGSDYERGRELAWVEARRYPSGETVLVPVELAASRFADLLPEEREGGRLFTPITNGLGAGPTFELAMGHGLLELVQRDGNSVTYRALDRGVAIDLDAVADPETRELLDHLEREGVEVIPKLAATDFGMTNLYVVGHDRDPAMAPHPVMLSACGEAAHPNRERALRKALLEFVAARSRKFFSHASLEAVASVAPPEYLDHFRRRPLESEEDRSLEAMIGWMGLSHAEMMDLLADPVFAVRRRVSFSGLPHTNLDPDDREGLLDLVAGRLRDAGLDVLYVDTSPPGGDAAAVHAIVPGLEVETASYGRIGARNLRRLLDRGSDLVRVGDAPPGGGRVLLPGREEEKLGPAWLDFEALERTVGRLYPLYREPGRHVVPLVVGKDRARNR